MTHHHWIIFLLLTTVGAACPALATQRQTPAPSQDPSKLGAGQSSSPSPDSTLLGVTWTPPDAPGPTLHKLDRIHATGVSAIRLTAVPSNDALFVRADSLDLQLFVDLPVSSVTASALRDSLFQTQPTVDRIREVAREHESVTHVGLAQYADTTVPAACAVLREWTTRLHNGPSPLRTYYVTPFRPLADRCAGAVDLVLLDTRGRPNPVQLWQRATSDTSRTGLGALGTWVRPDAPSGLRAPHSPERQARYLERALAQVHDAAEGPAAVFVHRWADPSTPPVPDRQYGLHDTSGTQRPAAAVVQGFYTGTQRVFAFSSGPGASSPHGLILLGWGLVVVLAGLFAGRPFVRQTAYRYFAAPGFYRDAVQEARDVSPGINTVLLFLGATATGLIAAVLARLAASSPTTEHVLAALPPGLRGPLAIGVTQPALAGIVMGGLTVGLLAGWTGALVLTARSASPFSVPQALMLVVWPVWVVFPGMILALVTATHPPVSPALLGGGLVVGGIVASLAVVGRVLYDYNRITDVSVPVTLALILPSPPVLVGLTLGVVAVQSQVPLSLLWHLLTKT